MSCGCTKIAKTVGKGVVGLTVSAVGPTATPEIIRERKATCDACDDKRPTKAGAFCGRCKCYLPALRRIREPQCEEFER